MTTVEENTQKSIKYDVIVIGGGPAGSTFSTLLHEKGRNVLLLEKDHHPRFHIGESLLPMTLPILDKLGVSQEIKDIGILKYGAEFNSSKEDNKRETFYFDYAMDRDHPHAYEVRRSEFDEILFRNAADKGVDCREGTRVSDVDFNPDNTVTVTTVTGDGQSLQLTCQFLVDASGRESLLSRRKKLKKKSKKHNSAAIFGHFENVTRRTGKDEGNISIYWFEHGWFWMIPLKDGMMSVGAVCFPEYLKTRDCSPEDFLQHTINMAPEVAERMKDSTLAGEVRATGNFTYSSSRMFGKPGENYLLIGDAYAFIDPVFSSGVHIAMSGAVDAAETIDACLMNPENSQNYLKQYKSKIDDALKTFSWLIHRFNSPVIHKLFMAPGNNFRIQEGIISLLAGDLYRDTPVKSRLFMFKIIYYVMCVFHFPATLASYRKRKRNIRMVFSGGTTAQDLID
ncbi:MAG: NAD(P)/FAD-dependent oxidoreductase [Pseudomonadota bacterium]|nr:NAD(P)/FAD-dependent oxidoreductase [Pseudomonadota bacterium]